jgi:hypothetical protein
MPIENQEEPKEYAEAEIQEICARIVKGDPLAGLDLIAYCQGRTMEKAQIINGKEHLKNPVQKARLEKLEKELAPYLHAFRRVQDAMAFRK